MLINNYTPPVKFDPTTRPWYQAAMETKPDTSIGLPYQEIKSKEWLVSTSRALKQPDGKYSGVVAIDCSINQVVKLISQHDEYRTEVIFVIDRLGKIILHPDPSVIGKYFQGMNQNTSQNSDGDFTFKVNNVSSFAHYSLVPSTGWTVVTVVEKDEILRPIMLKVLMFVGLTGLVAMLLGLAQSALLSRRISRPLVELSKKIKATVAGKDLAGEEYIYPNNDIGIMAREIGLMAEKELNARTRELQASEEIYKSILMASPDDITIADLSGRLIMFSDAASNMFGYGPEEGIDLSVMDFIAPEDHERARANIVRMIHENYHGPNEYRAIRKDGSTFDIEVSNSLVRDQQGNPIRMVLIARDITNRKKSEHQIQELLHQIRIERDLAERNSLTDSLTGLYNRRYLDIALRTEFSRYKRSGSQLSLIILDVDHFKNYNDHYGHLEGDDCLRLITHAIIAVVGRDPDIVARYGGEEFVVILPDTNSHGAALLAERIRESVLGLAVPHAKSVTSEFVTISLGVTTAADHGHSGAQLFLG